MRPLPFTAQPLLFTGRMMLEPGLLMFLVLVLVSLPTQTLNVSVLVADVVIGAPAILYPLWLWSRKLTVTTEGVAYFRWFWRTVRIPFTEVQTITIEGKRMMVVGHFYMYYFLSITSASGRVIQVSMDNYLEADLRGVAQEIVAHTEQVRLKGLAKGLLDGSHSFAKVRVP